MSIKFVNGDGKTIVVGTMVPMDKYIMCLIIKRYEISQILI
jgi:hypothetical protein